MTSTIHHPITFDRDIALQNTQEWGLRLLIRRWHRFLQMQTQVTRQLPYITTVSENSRRDIASAFGISEKRIKVVLNGIDSDIFQPMPAVAREPYHLITTASADQPLKGIQHLILHAVIVGVICCIDSANKKWVPFHMFELGHSYFVQSHGGGLLGFDFNWISQHFQILWIHTKRIGFVHQKDSHFT